MAKKINTRGSGIRIEDNRVKESYTAGTPLKQIINIPSDFSQQAKLTSAQPTMDAMNRLRWANFHGGLTEYPEERSVPVFRYTPGVLAEMKKKGITKDYIESWQPANYGSNLDYVASNYVDGGEVKGDPKLPKGYRGVTTEGEPYGQPWFPYASIFSKDSRVSGMHPVGMEVHAKNKMDLAEIAEKKGETEKAVKYREEAQAIYNKVSKRPKMGDKYVDVDAISYAEGGEVPAFDVNKLAQMAPEELSKILSGILNAGSSKLISEIQEGRTNPSESMESLDKRGVATDILSTTAKGAGMGAAFGPIGAIVGGAVGLAGSGIKAIAGADERKEIRGDAFQDWTSRSAGSSVAANQELGYKKGGDIEGDPSKKMSKQMMYNLPPGIRDAVLNLNDPQRFRYESSIQTLDPVSLKGGKIKGKGTGKSDDVPMKAPEGAFIVPAENSSKAMEYGKDYLGWDDNEVASRNTGGVGINASNGEVYYTPEEYEVLNYYGIDVDGLAPNAEENQTGFCRGGKIKRADGGPVTIEDLEKQNQESLERDIFDPMNTYISNTMSDIDKSVAQETFPNVDKAPLPEGENPFLKKMMNNIGVVAGVAQTAGATAGLIEAGRRPDINVSTTLKRLSRDAREAAGYGLPPAAKNALKKDQERSYQKAVSEISGKGGSPQDIHNQIISALSTRLAAGEKTELVDYGAQEEKVKRSEAIDLRLAGQELDVSKIGLASWERDQDVWANLLSAGIENVIGAKQYQEQLKWMKENTDRGMTFTLPT